MTSERTRKLIRGWVAMQRGWPAYQRLTAIVRGENAKAAWRILEALVRTVPQPLLVMVGAGPLEDFVKRNADHYIERLEACASESPRWRQALKHVWFRPSETAVAEQLIALGCTGIDVPPRHATRRSSKRSRKARARR